MFSTNMVSTWYFKSFLTIGLFIPPNWIQKAEIFQSTPGLFLIFRQKKETLIKVSKKTVFLFGFLRLK